MMMAFALQNEGEVKPKDQDGTGRLIEQSRGVCGCFHLTANMGQQSVIGITPDCKSGPYGIVGSSPTWPTSTADD